MERPQLPPEYAPRTVADLLVDRAAGSGDSSRPYLVAVAGDEGYVELTPVGLDGRASSLASGLRDRAGVAKGSKVVWLMSNSRGADALVVVHAVARSGAVNVPVNTRLAPREIGHILTHSEATVCVYEDALADKVAEALELVEGRVQRVVVGEDPRADHRLADLEAAGGDPVDVEVSESDDAALIYTSGTTGRPKGVVLSHGASIASAIAWADVFRLGPRDVVQSPFPVFSGAALHFNALSSLWAGATFVLDDYETERSLKLLEERRSTVYVAVPSIYQFWLESSVLPTVDASSVRILCYGGASMPAPLISRLAEVFTNAGLMQTYGLTEGGPGGTYLAEEYALTKLGSIGNRPAGRFTEVRVVDDDDRDVGPGQVGELLLRGPSVMKGYFKDPEETAATFTDGWLRSGDVVRVDREGFVFHLDRKKDIIVRGGYNVASVEVETVLFEHPGVADTAVVARSHPRLGEDVVAFVVKRRGSDPTVEELRDHCAEALADFKVPGDVLFVDELPRNSAGKVLKRDLRADADRQREASAP